MNVKRFFAATLAILFTLIFTSCNKEEETAVSSSSLPGLTLPDNRLIIDNVTYNQSADEFTVSGKNLDQVEEAMLASSNNSTSLSISSKSPSSLTLEKSNSDVFEITTTKMINLVLSTAYGSATVSLSFMIEDLSVTEAKITIDAVTADKIQDSTITGDKIANGTIDLDKLSQSAASDGQVIAWSESSSQWVPITFAVLDEVAGSVNEITLGTGLVAEGFKITNTGTIAVNVGHDPEDIVQYDSNGDLDIQNKLIINNEGGDNQGRLYFDTDNQDYQIYADGDELIIYDSKNQIEAIRINSDGNVIIEKDLSVWGELSIQDTYTFPSDAPVAGKLMATDADGKVDWLSLSEIDGSDASVTVEGSGSISVAEAPDDTFTISIDPTLNDVPISVGAFDTFTKVQINDEGFVINQDQLEAADIPTGISAANISDGNVDNDEFNTLDGINTTKTIETRLVALEDVDMSEYLNRISGGDIEGQVRMTNGADLVISSGSDLIVESGATITLETASTFIGNNFIDADDLADDSVTTNEILNETIINEDINTNALISYSKMEPLSPEKILVTDSDGVVTASSIDIDSLKNIPLITGDNLIATGASTISSSAIENTAIGINALKSIISGDGNTAVGFGAGETLKTGSRNVLIGYGARTPSTSTNDFLAISNGVSQLIEGSFSTNSVTINGTLNVDGDINIGVVKFDEIETLDGIDTTQLIEDRLVKVEGKSLITETTDYADSGVTSHQSNGCPTDEALVGGGCFCDNGELLTKSHPSTKVVGPYVISFWYCECSRVTDIVVTQTCAKVE